MTPQELGAGMWKLFENEQVTGEGGTIEGPTIVRVLEFPDMDKLLVQAGKQKVEVEGSDFVEAVQLKA